MRTLATTKKERRRSRGQAATLGRAEAVSGVLRSAGEMPRGRGHWRKTASLVLSCRYLYLMAFPGLALIFIFDYLPMTGLLIAFKDYKFSKGIFGSRWIGLENFRFIFVEYPRFYEVLWNTFVISVLKILFSFPVPILLALMLNELKNLGYKKMVQTAVYLPHFVSWAIFGSLVIQFLSPEYGVINELLVLLGGKKVFFMAEPRYFRPIVVVSDIMKESGWASIIYIAAISNIDIELYDAAIIDGTNRWQRARYITVPGISDSIVFLLLLNLGRILNVSFEQIWVLLNPLLNNVGDIISTYVYRIGIRGAKFSLATAIGFFQSVVGLTLIASSNYVSKRLFGRSIW